MRDGQELWCRDLKSHDPFDLQSTGFATSLITAIPNKTLMKYGIGGLNKLNTKFPRLSKVCSKKRADHTIAYYISSASLVGTRNTDYVQSLLKTEFSLPFDWVMGPGQVSRAGVPYITIYTYCIDALLNYQRDWKKDLLDLLYQIDATIKTDFVFIVDEPTRACISYSPRFISLKVLNANTYAAASLYTLYPFLEQDDSIHLADRLNNYVLDYQRGDGSWAYHVDTDTPADALHHIYILNNLYRCYRMNKDYRIKFAIAKGLDYLLKNHYRESYMDAIPDWIGGIMYDWKNKDQVSLITQSEAIILFSLLHEDFNTRHLVPMLMYNLDFIRQSVYYARWGQVQKLYAESLVWYLFEKKHTVGDIVGF